MEKSILRSTSDELRKHIRWAEENGWSVSRTKKNHLKFTRDGVPSVFFSGTPSDRRSIKNHKSQLRRAAAGV